MPIKLHNTLTKQVETFEPQVDNMVKLYTCGPTVYDYLHVGNWTAYIYWDILVRTLRAHDYDVERVMNITDVGHLVSDADDGEDKLEKGAKRENKTAWQVAEFYTKDFLEGMKELNLVTPNHITKATDYIEQQLDLVRILKDKGYTYQIDDGIYFDTSKFPTYADFAGLDLDAQRAGARVAFNDEKRNPSDFALWKFTPSGEKRDMEWETPVDLLDTVLSRSSTESEETSATRVSSDASQSETRSEAVSDDSSSEKARGVKMGFPGWHLECSAMAMDILGETLDIHTGGIDHIPVHHTNEIAQSEAASGKIFSNYWLHNNHMKVNGTKISKSLQNGYTLKDLEEKGYSAMDFRLFVLQGHYRSEGNFTFENLDAAKNRLAHWRNVAALRHQSHGSVDDTDESPSLAAIGAIKEALYDDLNTPEALRIIDETFSNIEEHGIDKIDRHALVQLLETIDELLGLNLISETPDISDEQKQRVLERERAREEKDWVKSDELRDELLKQNIVVKDTSNGSVWEYR